MLGLQRKQKPGMDLCSYLESKERRNAQAGQDARVVEEAYEALCLDETPVPKNEQRE